MVNDLFSQPLARWDGLHLVLDLKLVERHLESLLEGVENVRNLRLRGKGDAVAVEATAVWKGVQARIGLELAEIRLRHRHLGLRARKLRALGGIWVPRALLETVLGSLESSIVRVFPGHGIVVVDLRRWLPTELDIEVLTVQATALSLHIWFGDGCLRELPGREPLRLSEESVTS